jgi:hypothetical protein
MRTERLDGREYYTPGYVLGALDREEVDLVEIHLRSRHEHDQELVELRATVFALDPFADERSLDVAGERGQAHLAHRPKPLRGRALPSWVAFDRAWHVAIAAIVVLAVLGTGWFVGHITGDRDEQDFTILVQGPGSKLVSLSGGAEQDDVAVTMAGFETLPSRLSALGYPRWRVVADRRLQPEGRWPLAGLSFRSR